MKWTQSHNAGQTLTYFKKLPKDTAGCCASASLTLFGCPRGVSFSLPFKPFALFFFHMKCKTKDISLFIPLKGYLDWVLNPSFFDFKLSLFFFFFCSSFWITLGYFFSVSLCLPPCPRLCHRSFLICLVCLPCNSVQWAAGPAREPLSYWFNDASSYFTGIYMSVLLNTLSTLIYTLV